MEDLEQASTALVEYGYTHEEDGSFIRYKVGAPRDKWVPKSGFRHVLDESKPEPTFKKEAVVGFLRFTRRDGKWAPVPYTISAKWAKTAGLDADEHPECFDFIYPADYVLNIYAEAVQSGE